MRETTNGMTFGFTAAAAATGPDSSTDAARYGQMMADCRLGAALGYDTAWVLEHHFTDYFPTPSPLVVMAHLAEALHSAGLSPLITSGASEVICKCSSIF